MGTLKTYIAIILIKDSLQYQYELNHFGPNKMDGNT